MLKSSNLNLNEKAIKLSIIVPVYNGENISDKLRVLNSIQK